ncbi:helix-turn-helix domain-containing protein [Pseudoclavibacter sp. 13-3]|uniref:helix-turn-helix domain-containing protein n=1 Tax=Pseudoclavibacter sp. 13-3 TaxID=2901228 RepID=UPI001E6379E8|nr:helix-turn-helix transcriptional regulator [Pseudoclavibacter sp. 13-3]MCD7100475.1 helix-turn-helix domain-containing protein [Pseudoclavibacter sp. 13-3]
MDTAAERFNRAVGAQIRAEIAAHGDTVKGVSEKTGISRSSLVKYLDGERHIPVSSVYRISSLWALPPEVIVERASERYFLDESQRRSPATVTDLSSRRHDAPPFEVHEERGAAYDQADGEVSDPEEP